MYLIYQMPDLEIPEVGIMKKALNPRLMMIVSMAIFGTLGIFVRNIPVSSGELALYRAVLAATLIGCYLLLTKQKFSFDSNGKLANCESRDAKKCEIFIVEGDSALGACKQSRNSEFQAIMPVRGKILNCLKADLNKIFKSDIITDLLKVHSFAIRSGLKYLDRLLTDFRHPNIQHQPGQQNFGDCPDKNSSSGQNN